MTFKEFKTRIRKKIGLVRIAEFSDNPILHNSLDNWNSLFKNKIFLKEYIDKKRVKFYQELVNSLVKNQVFNNCTNLIDFGCGTGHLLLEINKIYPDISLTGTDFSFHAVEVAKIILPNSIFETSDIYQISNNLKNKFDVVICSEVLEHLLYPEKAINNLQTLLKDNKGYIILSVPDGRKDKYEGHINFWSPESWKIFIENNCKDAVIEYFLIENKMVNLAIIKF